MDAWTRVILAMAIIMPVAMSAGAAYGHGTGIDTIRYIDLDGRKVLVSVELPTSFEEGQPKQLTVTAAEPDSDKPVEAVTYRLGIFHGGDLILLDSFFAPDGRLALDATGLDGPVRVHGERDGPLDSWRAGGTEPLRIDGPVFGSGGLYTFEIEILTIDSPGNEVDSGIYSADLTLVDTTEYVESDSAGRDVAFLLKSYFDEASSFEYDPSMSQVVFEMPFDWSEARMSHVPVVHMEVHFPSSFAEFFHPGYEGMANGVDLFKSSVQIDDYTVEDERIVHFVLLQDHLRLIKNQIKGPDGQLPDSITFTLSASDAIEFPMMAYTRGEDYRVDLSWDPVEIEPGTKTNFVFTIRDGTTGEPLRNSDYDFVILQGGQEIHRASGQAQVGGYFEAYEFAENQTGPTVIRFEDIRNTGQETEFGVVVVPEFGAVAVVALVAGMASAVVLARRGPTWNGSV